ncbi:MAG TPA: hypothetical protein VFA55_03620, partial [Candidatus Kapabacteria bacterium]|nr:hypothetical protein [Candidatus Kapabacteria bacterium]
MNGIHKLIVASALIACVILYSQAYAQVNPAAAQINFPAEWSFTANAGYNIGVSPTMRGTADQFVGDVIASYNNSKYPFGDPSTTSSDLG